MTYVRRYTSVDWPQVIEIARQFHKESPVHSRFPFDQKQVQTLLDSALNNRDWLPAVAVDDEGIVGIMLLFHMPMFFGPASEVGDLTFYVIPGKRGTRAAAKMMDFAVSWATAIGASVIRLGITTGIRDDAAQRFFEKCGYRMVGRHMELVL